MNDRGAVSRKLRVLLEASHLGFAFDHAEDSFRAGIFRTTEHLLDALLRREDLELELVGLYTLLGETRLAAYLQARRPEALPRLVNAWHSPIRFGRNGLELLRRSLAAATAGDPTDYFALRRELDTLIRRPLETEYDVLQCLHALPQPGHVRAKARAYLVHDVIPFTHPEFTDDRLRLAMADRFLDFDRKNDWLICPARHTAETTCEYLGADPGRCRILPWAVDPKVFFHEHDTGRRQATLARYGLMDGTYLLSLCTFDPRKNLVGLLDAFFALCDRQPTNEWRLALVGAPGPASAEVHDRIERAGRAGERVLLLGYVPDADLSAIYSGARAFAYVSHCEGFGLPPLEAMQCGTPVVVADNTSLPEVVGEAALQVSSTDHLGLVGALARVLGDEPLRADLIVRGLVRAARFTWDRSAEILIGHWRDFAKERRV